MISSSPPSSSSEDFVHIKMPSDKNDDNGTNQRRRRHAHHDSNHAAADEETAAGTLPTYHNNNNNVTTTNSSSPAAAAQRSLLQTLWSEATSTTDLHQRRKVTRRISNSGKHHDHITASSSSSLSKRSHGKKNNHSYNFNGSRRTKRVATKVWLSAIAALAMALLIKIHIFLYQVLTENNNSEDNVLSSTTSTNNNIQGVDAATLQRLLDKHNIDPDDTHSKMTLQEAHSHKLAPLFTDNKNKNIDTSQYTIRMNTWHRNEQLLLSINHHAQCEGVAEIQIIWCDTLNDPPDSVLHHSSGKVKIERHDINSLNERFKIVLDTPTLGILSLDDDVLRPCEALDAAFLRWVRHPERMIGFDVRTHVVVVENSVDNDGGVVGKKNEEEEKKKKTTTNWKYGYMSTTEKSNSYSLTLPRASFLHKDYLDLYIMAMPRPIYLYVAQHFECEDIAMSFFVSSLTGGKPPLITDYWAVKSMVKLYSEKKISGGKDHKSARDKCVDRFAELLGVKEDGEWGPLQTAELVHDVDDPMFGYGAEPEDWDGMDELSLSSARLKELVVTMKELKTKSYNDQLKWLKRKKYVTMKEAKKVGMIEKTEEWEKRWRSGEDET
ncbi:glycosyltransfearse (family 64) [Skeletonema marinoi]|uniref:Glycosyltransfearse (Family 64) n=1 Tax=Skeletonema marinoi TaxID=267567 RepID=A0AAD9DA16_9STRA|nr:glycosyltransfearse (family 64) [Skeletonema marinoi]